MPIINNATIQKHPKLKFKQHKKKNSDLISSPNSILSVLSHLDHKTLMKLDINKHDRWKISFNKLRKNTSISKTEILVMRNELCKSNPIIFLTGSTRQTPYQQWTKLNDFYLSASDNPPNNPENHRPISILIPKFCIKFDRNTIISN